MNNDFEIQREAIIEIVGTQYEGRAVNHFGLNEHQKLIIKHQPDNSHDSNAVMILTGDKKKLGYVPEKDNIVFARLMDAGKFLTAKITKIEKRGSFHQISIGIYLVDF